MWKELIVQAQTVKSWDGTFGLWSMEFNIQYLADIKVPYYLRYPHTVTTFFRLSVVDNGGLYRSMRGGRQRGIHTKTHMSGDAVVP